MLLVVTSNASVRLSYATHRRHHPCVDNALERRQSISGKTVAKVLGGIVMGALMLVGGALIIVEITAMGLADEAKSAGGGSQGMARAI